MFPNAAVINAVYDTSYVNNITTMSSDDMIMDSCEYTRNYLSIPKWKKNQTNSYKYMLEVTMLISYGQVDLDISQHWFMWCLGTKLLSTPILTYRKTSNIRHTLVGNKIIDHSYVVGASPVTKHGQAKIDQKLPLTTTSTRFS